MQHGGGGGGGAEGEKVELHRVDERDAVPCVEGSVDGGQMAVDGG